jgi:DNA-binding MarR family transcriptional regulator
MTVSGPEAPDELDLVRQLARRLHRLEVHGARWGLSPHQARALLVLDRRHRHGDTGARVSELAGRLQVAPRSATEVADALEALGLLERRPDPGDRRAVRLTLTEQGRHVAAELHRERHRSAARLLSVLSGEERAQLRTLLERLIEASDG